MSQTEKSGRYTVDGGSELESRVDRILAETGDAVLSVVPENLVEGLALCGGYGRGEGGVFVDDEGREHLYNDLEFFLFLKGSPAVNTSRFGSDVHREAERLTELHGIEVELKISSMDTLQRSHPSMFYYDLVMGHRWVIGDAGLFESMDQHRDGSAIPLSEATRLLMNRLSGLVFTRARLEGESWTEEDSDFAQRNIAKTSLALWDAFLTAQGLYHWSCVERGKRLEDQIGGNAGHEFFDLVRWHASGRRFKLRPHLDRGLRGEEIEARLEEILPIARKVWLWVESERLGHAFENIEAYLHFRKTKTPDTFWVKNMLLNARFFGWQAVAGARGFRYPRERLFDSLTAALWANEPLRSETLKAATRRDNAGRYADWIGEYERLWGRFG